jgi:mRNA interferase RelE/StbE
MIICFYKKTFLNDLAGIPLRYRKRIERLVFEEIPKLDNIFNALDIKKMRGYRDYYRIRVGNYRVAYSQVLPEAISSCNLHLFYLYYIKFACSKRQIIQGFQRPLENIINIHHAN